jgi:hypothetical protein
VGVGGGWRWGWGWGRLSRGVGVGGNGLPAVSCQQRYLIIILFSPVLSPWCYRRGGGGGRGSYTRKSTDRMGTGRCAPGPGGGCFRQSHRTSQGLDVLYSII